MCAPVEIVLARRVVSSGGTRTRRISVEKIERIIDHTFQIFCLLVFGSVTLIAMPSKLPYYAKK
jgi:hypothetical protein